MARTILDEVLDFRPDYIEQQLAHAVRDPNGRAYNRTAHLPERRKMMQDWADYLDKLKASAETPDQSKRLSRTGEPLGGGRDGGRGINNKRRHKHIMLHCGEADSAVFALRIIPHYVHLPTTDFGWAGDTRPYRSREQSRAEKHSAVWGRGSLAGLNLGTV